MLRLVGDNDILVAGQADLYPHDRRNRLMSIVRALVHANAAGSQSLVDFFKAGNVIADFVFSPIGMLDIVKRNFEGDLHFCTRWISR
jgi:hypothetical protein